MLLGRMVSSPPDPHTARAGDSRVTCALVICKKEPIQPHHEDTHVSENVSGGMACTDARISVEVPLCWQCRPRGREGA